MYDFTYNALPARVVFGAGAVKQLSAEAERLGAKRILLLCTPGRAEMVRSLSAGLPVAAVFDEAVMHTPVNLVERAREQASSAKADCCAAVAAAAR